MECYVLEVLAKPLHAQSSSLETQLSQEWWCIAHQWWGTQWNFQWALSWGRARDSSVVTDMLLPDVVQESLSAGQHLIIEGCHPKLTCRDTLALNCCGYIFGLSKGFGRLKTAIVHKMFSQQPQRHCAEWAGVVNLVSVLLVERIRFGYFVLAGCRKHTGPFV